MQDVTIQVIGNIGKDVELKQHSTCDLLKFSVAVRISNEKTQWYDCVYFAQFETMMKNKILQEAKKGNRVIVCGFLKHHEKYNPEIVIDRFKVLVKNKENNDAKNSDDNFTFDDLPF